MDVRESQVWRNVMVFGILASTIRLHICPLGFVGLVIHVQNLEINIIWRNWWKIWNRNLYPIIFLNSLSGSEEGAILPICKWAQGFYSVTWNFLQTQLKEKLRFPPATGLVTFISICETWQETWMWNVELLKNCLNDLFNLLEKRHVLFIPAVQLSPRSSLLNVDSRLSYIINRFFLSCCVFV